MMRALSRLVSTSQAGVEDRERLGDFAVVALAAHHRQEFLADFYRPRRSAVPIRS